MIKKYNSVFFLLIFFFFFSGASWLMYEIIWQRLLHLIFGISTLAIATAFSSFMAGLALGSWFFGKRADVTKRPLRLYAFLEIGIALFAFISPHILYAIKLVYTFAHCHVGSIWYVMDIFEFLLCFSVLIIPAALMGGALPVVVRYLTKGPTHVGNRVESLYGVNTLGAAAGCIAAGFFYVSLGAAETVNIAAAINLAIGIVILLIDARLSSARIRPLPEKDDRIQLSLSPYPPNIRATILVIACISGFCGLAYEVLWTRAITFYLQPSIYSFPTILATFLASAALGSLISIIFADREKSSLVFIGVIQLLIGISAVVTIWEFRSISGLMAELWSTKSGGWSSFLRSGFVVSFIIMFIPTLLMGMIIPLVCRVYAHSINQTGKGIGYIYAIITVGAVAGLFITGFVLVPLIGITKAIFAISIINILVGTIVLVLRYFPRRVFIYSVVAASLAFFAVGISIMSGTAPISFRSPFFIDLAKGDKILFYDEGPGATITVRRLSPNVFDNNRYDLMDVDAVNVAGTAPGLRVTQKVQGHLPMILYKAGTGKEPENIFIMGLGTGESSHCICLHDIKKLDCLEPVPGAIKANQLFSKINHNILQNKKFSLTVNDARNFLLTSTTQYDVIEGDAIHQEIDIGTYTKEYLEICRTRLTEKGIFSSLIPLYGISEENFKIMLKTMQAVFPHVMVWYSPRYNSKHALLMGLKNRLTIDFERLKAEMDKGPIKESLADIGLDNPYVMLSCFLIDEQAISQYTANAVVNDDNHMYLPHNIPLQRLAGDRTIREPISVLLGISAQVKDYVVNYQNVDSAFVQRLGLALAIRDHLIEGAAYFFSRDFNGAFTSYEKAAGLAPEDRHIKYMLDQSRFLALIEKARGLAAAGALPEASQALLKALEFNPNSSAGYNELGLNYLMEGNLEPAKICFEKAISIIPDFEQAFLNLARVFLKKKMPKEARKNCEKALSLNPNMQMAKDMLKELER